MMVHKLPNYYRFLDIAPSVNQNEIFHAYTRAKRTYASDSLAAYSLMDAESSERAIAEIEEAYSILSNPTRRREYDSKMGFNSWGSPHQYDDMGRGSSSENQFPEEVNQIMTSFREKAPSGEFNSEGKNEGISDTFQRAQKIAKEVTSNRVLVASHTSDVYKKTNKNQEKAMPIEQFESNPEFEKSIEDCQELTGAFLKAVRVYRRMSPEQLALRCKLKVDHVASIEEERIEQGFETVYLRGHVQMMALELKIPRSQTLAQTFIQRMRLLGKIPKAAFASRS